MNAALPLSRQEKVELLQLLEEKKRRQAQKLALLQFESLYDWQLKFAAATASHHASMLMAANQVGKTRTGLTLDALHLLGDYPDSYPGHRFDRAPVCWLLGYSMVKTRDLLQSPLFGRLNGDKLSGGLIPADRIVDWRSASGTPGALSEVRVRHSSGDISVVQFWSYSQGQHALMGDVVDWYHIDEEPKDKNIYPQVITRTINGDGGKGGRGILTFTPENGRTALVVDFMDTPDESQYLQRATWDEAKHLSEEMKAVLIGQYPPWQRDMRTKGLPLLGAGLIFDFSDDDIKVPAFECPPHWWVVNGMDFGWDHPQAHVQLWHDRDTDVIYVAQAWKKSRVTPSTVWGAIKSWSHGVPTAWPHDGLQTEKGSGAQQKQAYADAGWQMMPEMATWPAGGNGVEFGLVELYDRMSNGRLKVFSHLSDWFEEKLNYHRDESGNIVKVNDDLLSATRYAYMMRRYAKQRKDISSGARPVKIPQPLKSMGRK